MNKKFALTVATSGILPFLASSLPASMAYLAFEDGQMDSVTPFSDIAAGEIEFNLSNGEYTVVWTAYASFDFWAPLEINFVLYNLSPMPEHYAPEEYQEYVVLRHTVSGEQMYNSIQWSGIEPALAKWSPGDQIATYYTSEDGSESLISSVRSTLFNNDSPNDQVLFVGYLDEVGEAPAPDPQPEPDPPDVPEKDTDNDGVPDHLDKFIESDLSATVILHGVDTGIINEIPGLPVTEFGATLADVIHQLEMEATSSTNTMGQYVKHFGANLKILVQDGWITNRERARLIAIIAGNDG